jgi:hypothetical protein
MRHPDSSAALSFAALFLSAWLPALARAQDDGGWSRLKLDMCSPGCELAATTGLGLPVLAFSVADIAYISQGSVLPRGLAYAQISFGVTAGVIGALGLAGASFDPRFAMLIAAGTLLSVVGLLSVVLYERPAAPTTRRARIQAALVPLPRGLMAGLSAQL